MIEHNPDTQYTMHSFESNDTFGQVFFPKQSNPNRFKCRQQRKMFFFSISTLFGKVIYFSVKKKQNRQNIIIIKLEHGLYRDVHSLTGTNAFQMYKHTNISVTVGLRERVLFFVTFWIQSKYMAKLIWWKETHDN